MGSLCSSLFGSSASTSYQPPEAVKGAITDILGRAATQSNQPFPQYTPATAAQYQNYNAGLLSPMTPNQAQAGQTISGLQGGTQPSFQQASQMVQNAAQPIEMQQFNQGNINQYMNPYLNDVVGSAVANINQTNAQQQQQVLGNAIQRGAFGGDRAGIAQAELARQQNLANNATISNLLGQGYSQAQGEFNTQQQTGLATQLQNRQLQSANALNLANLGTQGQNAALQQAQAQYGYGTAEQQQQQAGLSTAYQQYMNQQAFPYQQLSYYAGLASGAAPAMGGTTTGYSPTVSNAGGLLGGLSMLGGLSNPGGISASNPMSAAASGLGSIFSMLKTGGRVNYEQGGAVGYASGGSPTSSSIVDAYNRYQTLVTQHAPKPILDQAYQEYKDAFIGAPAPYADTAVTTAAKPTTTATATPATPAIDTSGRGGDGSAGVSDVSTFNPSTSANSYLPIEVAAPKGLLGKIGTGLMGGVDQTTGAQTGIKGAFDALFHGNSPGTYNANGMATNMVADPSQGGRDMPNTASGMTAQQWADQFTGGDLSKVGAGFTNVNGQRQIDFFNMDNGLAKALHYGAIPATQLDPSLIGTPAAVEDTSGITDPLAGGADLAASKTGLGAVGSRSAGFTGDYAKLAHDLEVQNSLPAGTLSGIANVETGGTYNPDASNKSGSSLGLMQFQPKTAEAYGVTNPFDPVQALTGAAQYAADIANKQKDPTVGSIGLAYNQGLGGYKNLTNADPNARAIDVLGSHFASNRFGLPMDATVADFMAASQGAYQKGAVATPSPAFDPSNPPAPPSNPSYSAGLSQIASNIAAPSAGAEGHGPGSGYAGLDRTTSEVNNTPSETGGALGGRGNSPSVADHADVKAEADTQAKAEADTQFGDARTSDPDSAEKRGGRIHPHHYAAGGYAPISMMYGMPTESDISQIASDEAGSGAGVLGPQLQALAAKGVLPSAKGGRIGYGDPKPGGAVKSQDDSDNMWSSPDQPAYTAQPESDGSILSPMGKGVLDWWTGKNVTQEDLDRAYETGKKVMGAPSTQDTIAAPTEKRSATGTYFPSEKTQPIIPSVEAQPDKAPRTPVVSKNRPTAADLATTEEETAPKQRVPTNVVAQDTTRRTSDAAQPGFGYIAPPPIDMRQIAALNFGANLLSGGDFGTNLSRAGQGFANTMLEQQKQQRETMLNQAQSAAQYGSAQSSQATAGKTRAEEQGLRVTPNPFGGNALFMAGTPENPEYKYINMPSPGGAGDQGGGATSTSELAPLGQALQEKTSILDQYANTLKNQVGNTVYSADTAKSLKNKFEDTAAETSKSAQIANTALGDASTMAHDLVIAQQNGWGTMGAGDKFRLASIRAAATAARIAGYNVSDDPVVASQELQKISRLMANQQVGSISHQAAARTIDATEAALPGTPLEPESANKVFTSIMRQSVMARDAQQAVNYFGGKTARMGANVDQAIQAAYPPEQYNKEQNALQDLMSPDLSWKNPKGRSINLVTELMDGHISKPDFDAKVQKYYPGVKHLSRWLVN